MKAPRITRLPATDFSLPLLLPSKSVFFVTDTLSKVEVEKPEVEEPSAKQARSSGTTHPNATVTRSIFSPDRLSVLRNFVGHMGVDVEFLETE